MSDFVSLLRTGTRRWRLGMVNGPNMSNLAKRDRKIYGAVDDLAQVEEQMSGFAAALGVDISASICSNHEGEIVDWIQARGDELDGILINPASLTIYGLSTVHALADSGLPVVEVHFSNIAALDIPSLFTKTAVGICSGMRRHSYTAALVAMVAMLDDGDYQAPGGGAASAEAAP